MKNLNLKSVLNILMFVCVTGLYSCSNKDENQPDPILSVEPSMLSFKSGEDSCNVVVTTNQQSWNVTSNQTWCTVAKGENQFKVTAAANTETSNRTAIITVTAGNATDVALSVTQESIPNIAFVANPVTEYLYKNGFFYGSRVKFDLVVYDAAGSTSITIEETAKGAPNGNSKEIKQTRIIPISGPGTYPLSQEMWNDNAYNADRYSQFTYTVSACGKSYTRNYTGSYSAYNGSWSHYFGIRE
jgi:hypothetical protein